MPLDGMLVHHRVTPSIKFPGPFLYTWVERDTVRVKCVAYECNRIHQASAERRPLDTGPSVLTMRPLHFYTVCND